MSNPYLGEIRMFAGNFAPKNWAFCNGQTLAIQQYTALFSLLGTNYGGNGQTTFALPDLQSRLPVHQGQGSGLSSYQIGQAGGTATVALNQTAIPTHSHTFNVTTIATAAEISNTVLPGIPTVSGGYTYANQLNQSVNPTLVEQTLVAGACGTAGGNQPHSNLMPSLCVSFIIALQGIFPSRN